MRAGGGQLPRTPRKRLEVTRTGYVHSAKMHVPLTLKSGFVNRQQQQIPDAL